MRPAGGYLSRRRLVRALLEVRPAGGQLSRRRLVRAGLEVRPAGLVTLSMAPSGNTLTDRETFRLYHLFYRSISNSSLSAETLCSVRRGSY